MFRHLFYYRLKCLLRDRELLFWTLLFPLLLATFFYFAFGHLTSEQERFDPVKTVVVDNRAYRENSRFKQLLESLSLSGEDRLLELTVAGEKEAEQLLDSGAVSGIITVGETISLTVKESGLEQSILKTILDQYAHTAETAASIISKNPGAARQLAAELGKGRQFTEPHSFSGAPPDTTLGYFYALIAMACLYSAFWGLRNTIDLQADLSPLGARRSVAPTHKLKVVLSDNLAALLISFSEILVLLIYLEFVLKISLGNQAAYVLIACLAGCMSGVFFGNFIGTVIRGTEGLKSGVLVGVSMTMSFLAGLMWVEMKYVIAGKIPLLSYINPAALIADAFYSLYLFENHHRFFVNIALLCLISAAMGGASFMRLRRGKYAGI
ncbi:MAG: ABC transporter permease [Firmicutes bacterium]|nr:ABC transporter permease [Bacillota bacterium]